MWARKGPAFIRMASHPRVSLGLVLAALENVQKVLSASASTQEDGVYPPTMWKMAKNTWDGKEGS